uniref:Dynein, light chain, roadblock-type 1 n=1 Tax=Poecilia reticulata TaxID=8081 RepID=A0A3P9QDG1_POERE
MVGFLQVLRFPPTAQKHDCQVNWPLQILPSCECVCVCAWLCVLCVSVFHLFLIFKAEVDEIVKRLQAQKGVEGVIIANSEGIAIRSTLEDQRNTVQYVALIQPLLVKAKKMLQEMDPSDDFTYLRVRTEKNEIIITADKEYFMVAIQKPAP